MHASSNDVYRSTEHRAVAPQEVERFSLPASTVPSSDDTTEIRIRSGLKHSKYKNPEDRIVLVVSSG
uniref:Isopenicillin N synthase-like Fe(2+) 2OG dioxygenase domain-containing protein n=1 Tax=Salix viminalis TaxID=40686 RepID=A0A6N2MG10_SALVM